jgi:tRNA nucleotidyltransferase (CCA-adding enzyme)
MEIPYYIKQIVKELNYNNFEAYMVGGCVRDVLLKKNPKDWDITTNAKPEELLAIFMEGKYENIFGTVLYPIRDISGEVIDIVEITTYRSEQGYMDRRHPDEVFFEDKIDKDLERRDFTVNAMALGFTENENLSKEKYPEIENHIFELKDGLFLIDLFGGQKDLKAKILRAVGEPSVRFREDALRMVRSVRFMCELGFEIEPKTLRAIKALAGNIKFVSKERLRDELIKILASDSAYDGIMKLYDCKLLQYIIPELERGVDTTQNRHHIYTVFKHSVLSLKNCPSKDWRVRFASLLHDIAKPETKRIINGDATFYNHDIIGAKIAGKIMQRLKFSNKDQEKVVNLVRYHMFYYNVGEVTESSVRRLIVKVGVENLKDLIDVRIADRLGSGVPKAKPYKLRHLEYMMEKVRTDPISVKMLEIDGIKIMELIKCEPSPKIGAILDVLLSEIIDDPKLNNYAYLSERTHELSKLELNELRKKATEKIEVRKMEDDKELKKGFWV